jgi:hypothetical protein
MISVIDDTRGSQPTEGVPSRLPLRVSSVDLLGLEGIDTTHALLRRTLRVSHRVIEIWVQFGHLHPTRADVRLANDALAGVEISPLRRIVLLDAAGRPFTRIAVDGSPCAYGVVDAVASSRDAIYLIGAFRAGDRRDFVGVSRQSGKLIGAFGPPDLAGRDGQLLSLAVAAGRLFVSYSAGASQRLGLVALDPSSGAVVRSWRARPCGLGGGSLTAAGGRLYVWTHRLCALDASTGRQDPTWTPPADMLVTTVAASGSRLLVAS